MFCKFCKKYGHSARLCHHRISRFRSNPFNLKSWRRGKTLLKSDKNSKTEPTIADSNSADQIKQISDSNSVDLANAITDSNSVDLADEITDSNSVDTITQSTDSNSVALVNTPTKSIIGKPAVNAEKSDNRVNPIESSAISNTEMCQKLEQKIQKLKKEINELRQENLALNLLYFTSENTKYFDSKKSP